MAYSLKYTVSYKRLSNEDTNIEILQEGWTGGTTDLVPAAIPLTINFTGSESNIFLPSNGSGATIKVLAEPLTLIDLYTEDPQEFIVKIYDDVTLIWQGYISPEVYNEDYSMSPDLLSPITIECNDGMALLDSIPYLQTNGTAYTGYTLIAHVIEIICGKIENKYNELISLHDLMVTVTGYTNLYLGLTVSNQNYYDEKGIAMSCREVLNSIFQGLGLVMEFSGDKIIVFDPTQLRRPTMAKSYELSPGYSFEEEPASLGGFKAIGTEVPWFKTGQQLDVSKSFNQIEVNYDPYSFVSTGYQFDETENMTGDPTWTTGSTSDYRYSNDVILNDWIINNQYSYFSGISQITDNTSIVDVIGPPTYYFIQTGVTLASRDASKYVEYTFPNTLMKQDDNLFLELSFDMFLNTKNEYNIWTPVESATTISRAIVGEYELKIGDYYYNPYTGTWSTSQISFAVDVRQSDADWRTTKKTQRVWNWFLLGLSTYKTTYYITEDDSRVNDEWTRVTMTIDISEAAVAGADLLNGSMKLRMYKETPIPTILDETQTPVDPSSLINYMTRNIELGVTDRNRIPITNKGISVIANLPSTTSYIKKSELKVDLTNGTGIYGTSKGAFGSNEMYPVGLNIVGLYRTGDTEYNSTNWHVAQQLLSQYQKPRKKISANFDVSDDLLEIRYKLLTDTYLAGLSFYMYKGNYNDKDESVNCEIIEVANTYEELPVVTPTPIPPTPTPQPIITEIYVTVDAGLAYGCDWVKVNGTTITGGSFPVAPGGNTMGTSTITGLVTVQVGNGSEEEPVDNSVTLVGDEDDECQEITSPQNDFLTITFNGLDIGIDLENNACP